MRETRFINQNKKKWEEFEELLRKNEKDPARVSELFVQITDDLSFARTHYPARAVKVYLNNIARQAFKLIYQKKAEKGLFKKVKKFYAEECPAIIWKCRTELLISFLVFTVAVIAGMISTRHDPDFARYILGSDYVQMTNANIEKGDAMAVYKNGGQTSMFLGITSNNIRVSLITYVFGALMGVGSILILISNGVMLGTFQYYFIQRELFLESFSTVWLHGVPEIFAIVFSGAAGLRLGKGLVFPDSYSRLQSFQNSAWESLRMMLCILPVFIFAGFIESFITRYNDVHVSIRLGFIFLNVAVIVGYFILYPLRLKKKGTLVLPAERKVQAFDKFTYKKGNLLSGGEIISGCVDLYNRHFAGLFRIGLIFSILSALVFFSVGDETNYLRVNDTFIYLFFDKLLYMVNYELCPPLLFSNSLLFAFLTVFTLGYLEKTFKENHPPLTLKQKILFSLILSVPMLGANAFFFVEYPFLQRLLFAMFLPYVLCFAYLLVIKRQRFPDILINSFALPFSALIRFTGTYGVIAFLCLLVCFLLNTPIYYFYQSIVTWNVSSSIIDNNGFIFNVFTSFLVNFIVAPFLIAGTAFLCSTVFEIRSAEVLTDRIKAMKTDE